MDMTTQEKAELIARGGTDFPQDWTGYDYEDACIEVAQAYLNPWISVEERLPEKYGRYLTILASNARAQHAKRWAGMGKPEITVFCNDWPMKWNARGSLIVAFWQELPKFDMEWIMDVDGEQGHWQPNPPEE